MKIKKESIFGKIQKKFKLESFIFNWIFSVVVVYIGFFYIDKLFGILMAILLIPIYIRDILVTLNINRRKRQ